MNNEFETKNFFLRLHFSHVIFCHNDGARIVIRHKDASSSSVSPGPVTHKRDPSLTSQDCLWLKPIPRLHPPACVQVSTGGSQA